MPLVVKVTITGNDRVLKKMQKLGSSLYNFQDAMNTIGKSGKQYFGGVAFASQGGVFGNRWPRLNPKYAALKAKLYPGRSTLVASGTMQRSFDFNANRTSVTIGNTASHFKYHQSTQEPRTKIPRRQMIGINASFRRLVKDIIQDDVRNKIRNA